MGFDCIHVVGPIENLELWIGEVKFYKSINDAVNDVIKELKEHMKIDFLRDEFILIGNKLDFSDKYTPEIQKLISKRTSMDEIFKRICIPIMLTYESDTVKNNKKICNNYLLEIEKEIHKHYTNFCDKSKDFLKVRFHLFLLPLKDKDNLITILDTKLKAWQKI